MQSFEYKVVPAPEKAPKVRGLKGPDLFAHALEEVMNEMAAEGWAYLRAETLPQEERSGLTSKTTTYRNVLVFQRPLPSAEAVSDPAPAAEAAPPPTSEPRPQAAEEPPVDNLWTDTPEPEAPEAPQPLFPNRQRQGVDL